jgi:hypothetical protein
MTRPESAGPEASEPQQTETTEETIVTEVNEFNRHNIEEFRSNHGRLGGPFDGAPVLLLHTTEARSGQERVHPLIYLNDDGRYCCSPRRAGSTAAPRGTGTSLPTQTPVSKSETSTSTYTPLNWAAKSAKYAEQARRYPQYADYQRGTARTIPVLALIPT